MSRMDVATRIGSDTGERTGPGPVTGSPSPHVKHVVFHHMSCNAIGTGTDPPEMGGHLIWNLQNSMFCLLIVTSSYLLLVVRPGAPSSVLAPSSDARRP